jgi:hypothetical protein
LKSGYGFAVAMTISNRFAFFGDGLFTGTGKARPGDGTPTKRCGKLGAAAGD